MPNLAVLTGNGCIGIYSNLQLTSEPYKSYKMEDTDLINQLFGGLGLIIYLKSEKMFDAFTALSGSSAAYVLLLAEIIRTNAEVLGFK